MKTAQQLAIEKVKEFTKSFTDKWDNGRAVIYPIKEGVANIIPAEDLEAWLDKAILEAISEAFEETNPNKVIANHALQKQSDRDKSYGWNECVSELKSEQSKFLGKGTGSEGKDGIKI